MANDTIPVYPALLPDGGVIAVVEAGKAVPAKLAAVQPGHARNRFTRNGLAGDITIVKDRQWSTDDLREVYELERAGKCKVMSASQVFQYLKDQGVSDDS